MFDFASSSLSRCIIRLRTYVGLVILVQLWNIGQLNGNEVGNRQERVDQLRRCLADSELAVQCAAIYAIAEDEVHCLREELLSIAQSDRCPANEIAMNRLIEVGSHSEELAELVQEWILSEHRWKRVMGLKRLRVLDSETEERLRRELGNSSSSARSTALFVLNQHGRLSSSDVMPYLNDHDIHVRYEAMRILWKSDLRPSVMLKCISDREEMIVSAVLDELRPQDSSLEMVQHVSVWLTDPCLGRSAVRALGRFGERAAGSLPEIVASASFHALIRSDSDGQLSHRRDSYFVAAIWAMERIGPPQRDQISYLTSQLRHDSVLVRLLAAMAVGQCDPQDASVVKDALVDAIARVVSIGNTFGVNSGEPRVSSVSDPFEVEHYLRNLWITGCDSGQWLNAFASCADLFSDKDIESILDFVHGARRVPLMNAMLSQSNCRFRVAAMRSLQHNPVCNREIEQCLLQALRDESSFVRWEAMDALAAMPKSRLGIDDEFLVTQEVGTCIVPTVTLFRLAVRNQTHSDLLHDYFRKHLTASDVIEVADDSGLDRCDVIRYLAFDIDDPVDTVDWLIEDFGFRAFDVAWALRDYPKERAAAIDFWVGMPEWEQAIFDQVSVFTLIEPDSVHFGNLLEKLELYSLDTTCTYRAYAVALAICLMTKEDEGLQKLLDANASEEYHREAALYLKRLPLDRLLPESTRNQIYRWITSRGDIESVTSMPDEFIEALGRLHTNESEAALYRMTRSSDWCVRRCAMTTLRSSDMRFRGENSDDSNWTIAAPVGWEHRLKIEYETTSDLNKSVFMDAISAVHKEGEQAWNWRQITLLASELRSSGKTQAIDTLRMLRDEVGDYRAALLVPIIFEPVAAEKSISLLQWDLFQGYRVDIVVTDDGSLAVNGVPCGEGMQTESEDLYDSIGIDLNELLGFVQRECVVRNDLSGLVSDAESHQEIMSIVLQVLDRRD